MRLHRAWLAVGIVLTAVTTGCSAAVDGQGSVDTLVTRTPTGNFPAPTAAPATPPTAPPTTQQGGSSGTPGGRRLTALLEPMPRGAQSGHSAWAKNVTPTVEQFTAEVYQPQYAGAQANVLRSQGLTGIAHRLWIAANGDECDEILLSFRDSTGATSRYLAATSARRDDPTLRSFAIPGVAQAVGTYEPKLDSDGEIRSITYARSGATVVEQFGFDVAHLRPAELEEWLKAQLRRL